MPVAEGNGNLTNNIPTGAQPHVADRTVRILIADDDELFRTWLMTYLEAVGFCCEAVEDAKSATMALNSKPYDLLIGDVCMPGNSQLEFIHDIQRGYPELPIIIVTGQPTVKTAVDSMELRVAAYLVKPFEPTTLLSHIKQAILSKRLQSNIAATKQRITRWLADVNDIESLTELSRRRYDSAVPVDAYITLTLQNIIDPLLDLVHLAQGLISHQATGQTTENVCNLFKCPRVESYRRAIVETTDVLEQTKKSFKSKTLADLRSKLERYLSVSS